MLYFPIGHILFYRVTGSTIESFACFAGLGPETQA